MDEKKIIVQMIDRYLGKYRSDGREARKERLIAHANLTNRSYKARRNEYGNYNQTEIARITELTKDSAYIDYLRTLINNR